MRPHSLDTQQAARSLALAISACIALAPATPCADSAAKETPRILSVLRLAPGMTAADVGAGDGEFTFSLAHAVGTAGKVFATEVDRAELDKIEAKISADRIANVSAVLGDQLQTGLPEGCCDAILLRLVYHHFTDPAAMRLSL